MDRSIVEYFAGHEGYRCGYCNSSDGCYSHGMWAHMLTPLDYQNLINRGWRRSGKYCYKPTMNITCCPLYTIRCEATKFILSKSQKKVLKKVHKFLSYEDYGKQKHLASSESIRKQEMNHSQESDIQHLIHIKVTEVDHLKMKADQHNADCSSNDIEMSKKDSTATSDLKSEFSCQVNIGKDLTHTTSASRLSSFKPQCRKAKVVRQEKKMQKLLKMGKSLEEVKYLIQKKKKEVKVIEDFLNDALPENPAHNLSLRLVPCDLDNSLFCDTIEESYCVYKKYQMIVHKDTLDQCTMKQYIRFLVTNPFQNYNERFRKHYGSFHQQYVLDGKIIAVGVIDVLPYCLSSVYFYYDPDYSFLSLGTYAALREIAFTRELNKRDENLQYYYMGYYIHSCIKMQYKGQFQPSFLLCPEVYTFHSIEKIRLKLDESSYQKLEEDPAQKDTYGVVNLNEVKIFYNKKELKYTEYKQLKLNSDDVQEVKEYSSLVGQLCYSKMLLYRN